MRYILGIVFLFSLVLNREIPVYASQINDEDFIASNDSVLNDYDFDEIDESLAQIFPQEKLDFKETVRTVLSGDIRLTAELFNRLIKEQIGYAFVGCRSNLVHMILLSLMAALFINFSNVFQNKQISEISFYVIYLMMIALAINSFQMVTDWVSNGVDMISRFMSVFCPIYFVAVSVAKGSVTATSFYHLVIFLIYLVEMIISKFLLPIIHVYIMIRVLNHLSEEDYLSKFAELLEIAVSWILKTFVAGIVGINLVQGLINPAIDTVKRSAITRGTEAIPGIGDVLGGTAEVVAGTAVLVKNGIGMAGAIICFALCIVPLVQVALIVLMYKLSAAVIQPVSDKRVIGCLESVAEGCRLLLRVVFTTGLLFLLTIAIVATVTNTV
jgi:stage III sporulation protein AE